MNIITITGIATVLALIYYYVKRVFTYRERKGIPFLKPTFPKGNFQNFGKIHQSQLIQGFYNEMKGKAKFFGIYGFQSPIAIASDLEFIKSVMIKDFAHFQDRGMYSNPRDDPLSGHLFLIGGSKWRQLRTKLTPTFTSGKMKFMYPTVVKVSDEFKELIDDLTKAGTAEVEIKDLLARFTTDVIGSCAFGIDCNSLKNPDAEFRQMGRKIFAVEPGRFFKLMLVNTVPKIAKFLRMTLSRKEVSDFFMGIVRETVNYRETKGVKRNDFMDLLIKLKNTKDTDEKGNTVEGISMDELSAQAFVFFIAGFETSSTVMTYALHELAVNKELQQRAREEIKTVLAKHNNEFSYEAMIDMSYIDQILNESLRKYPPVSNLNRIVTKPYKVDGLDFTFEVGTKLWIPVYALHHDPEYFPKPEVFDPERFTSDQVAKRNHATYLPFGDGPRNCIGLRFGMMQARVGMVTLLSNYDISLSKNSIHPLVIDKKSFVLTAEGGVFLNFKKL